MTEAQTTQLEEIFRIVFNLSDEDDPQEIDRHHARWDSLSLVSLVAAIESEFGVRLEPTDAARLTSFGEVHALLIERGA
jgi:acyl carrier protein